MIHSIDIQLRFNDTDAFGHLNNAVFATFTESARMAFLAEVAGFEDNLILANLNIDYLAQVKFTDTLRVTTGVQKLGNTSITLKQDILANDKTAAQVSSVVVIFDYATQSPTRITDMARAKLEPYVVKALD